MNEKILIHSETRRFLLCLENEIKSCNGAVLIPNGNTLSFDIFLSSVSYRSVYGHDLKIAKKDIQTVTYRYQEDEGKIIRDLSQGEKLIRSQIVLKNVHLIKTDAGNEQSLFEGVPRHPEATRFRQVQIGFRREVTLGQAKRSKNDRIVEFQANFSVKSPYILPQTTKY